MASSAITRRALAKSFKEQLACKSFGQIRIGEVCASCAMNRKSFYYHFRDKQALLCWIMDSELAEYRRTHGGTFLGDLVGYLEGQRGFYRRCSQQWEGREALAVALGAVIGEACPQTSDVLTERLVRDLILSAILLWLVEESEISGQSLLCAVRASLDAVGALL